MGGITRFSSFLEIIDLVSLVVGLSISALDVVIDVDGVEMVTFSRAPVAAELCFTVAAVIVAISVYFEVNSVVGVVVGVVYTSEGVGGAVLQTLQDRGQRRFVSMSMSQSPLAA